MNHENRWFPPKPPGVRPRIGEKGEVPRERNASAVAIVGHGPEPPVQTVAERPALGAAGSKSPAGGAFAGVQSGRFDASIVNSSIEGPAAEANSSNSRAKLTAELSGADAVQQIGHPRETRSTPDSQPRPRILAADVQNQVLRTPTSSSADQVVVSAVGARWITGLLLLLISALLIPASYLTLLVDGMGLIPGKSQEWQAWRVVWFSADYDPYTTQRLLGVAFALCIVVGTVSGAVLIADSTRTAPRLSSLAMVAPSLLLGVTSTATLDVLSATSLEDRFQYTRIGPGFWPLIAAASASAVATVFTVASMSEHEVGAARRRSVDPGAALMAVSGAMAIVGSWMPLIVREHETVTTAWWNDDSYYTQLQFTGFPLVLVGFTAVVLAGLSFRPGVDGRSSAKAHRSMCATALFATTVTVVLTALSYGQGVIQPMAEMFNLVGPGFWVLLVATLLAAGSMVATMWSRR